MHRVTIASKFHSRPALAKVALLAVAATVVTALAAAPSPAHAAFTLGYADGTTFDSSSAAVRQQWLGRAAADGGQLALRVISWRSVAPSKRGSGFDPTDPADPAYDWGTYDGTVQDAVAAGLQPVLTVEGAPKWAEGKNRPKSAPDGTWKPSGKDLRDFATALARRYSGNFQGLPRVQYYQAWTEPNLSDHLTPQYKGKKLVSADIYRQLLNGFYAGIKSVSGSNRVITGGTAPYGEPAGGDRARPLTFLRGVLCLKSRKQLKATKCPTKARFDILSHHPINTSGGPTRSALNPDDASSADLPSVMKTLRAAEKQGTVAGGKHPLWATEFWWESNPPNPKLGVSPSKQAEYISESLYLFWKAGATAAINLRVRDGRYDPKDPYGRSGTGTYFRSGKAKPAARAMRFPFFAKRAHGKAEIWGKAPASGRVLIQAKRGKRWKRVDTLNAASDRIFHGKTHVSGNAKLRAKSGGQASLASRLK